MIVNFVYPSSRRRAGGVTVLYEFANALARRGHEVNFTHGPRQKDRINQVKDIPFRFDRAVRHRIVDTLDDPNLPAGDVRFGLGPRHLGQRAVIVQGFRLVGPTLDRAAFRVPGPKICVATWLVEVGQSYGVPEEQLVHIPLGLDHQLFSVRVPQRERTLDVAMLYHPWTAKGWDVGLQTLRELARRRPEFRAVVFSLTGAPPDPLPDCVQVVLDGDQRLLADEVYNQARVFVQASHHEGFGLTAIEAMACGAALVTTDCGGSRDYAAAGETALVVPAGDADGLAAKIDSLLGDEAKRVALADAGAGSVQRFDWDRSGRMLEGFLERYVADPGHFQQPAGEDRSAGYSL